MALTGSTSRASPGPPGAPAGAPAATTAGHGRGGNDIPVVDGRPVGPSRALAASFRDRHPATVFVAATILGYLALAGLMIGLGFLLVDELLRFYAVGAEEHVNTWLAAHRSSARDAASAVGSALGDVPTIPALVGLTALVMVWRRRFRVAAFIVGAILVEVATYRATSLLVHRERPDVVRLEHLPVDQSFPSGHVAASVVVYAGLALLITSRFRRRWVSIVCWTLAIALPAVVALSRMYRGMHHPTDVGAGALMGVGALLVALIATRACDWAELLRRRARRGVVGAGVRA
jgi:undecaprenyl-diphosphatase